MTRSITKHPVLVRWGSPNGSLVRFRIVGISLGLRTRSPNDPGPRFAIAYEDADDLDCLAFKLACQRGCLTVGGPVFAADPVASVIVDIDCDVVHRRRGARICVARSAAFTSVESRDDQPRGPRLPEADLFRGLPAALTPPAADRARVLNISPILPARSTSTVRQTERNPSDGARQKTDYIESA
jgi:hypothetical protein